MGLGFTFDTAQRAGSHTHALFADDPATAKETQREVLTRQVEHQRRHIDNFVQPCIARHRPSWHWNWTCH